MPQERRPRLPQKMPFSGSMCFSLRVGVAFRIPGGPLVSRPLRSSNQVDALLQAAVFQCADGAGLRDELCERDAGEESGVRQQ